MVLKGKKAAGPNRSHENTASSNQTQIKRKPFRSISQVLDTPVTPDLLAALPAPVQQTNLMMGAKMDRVLPTAADPQLVNAAMAAFSDQAHVLIAADNPTLLEVFKVLAMQLPIKVNLKTALQKQGLVAELNNSAKALVEGSGKQVDLVLCDPDIVKQDGQLVPLLHSQYSVPIALFSSTPEAIHTQLVDDFLRGPGNGDVTLTELAALILRWHAKSNGLPEPQLSRATAPPQTPHQMNGMSGARMNGMPGTSMGMGMNGGTGMGMPYQQYATESAAAGGDPVMAPPASAAAPVASQAPQAMMPMSSSPFSPANSTQVAAGNSQAAVASASGYDSSSTGIRPMLSTLKQEVSHLREELVSRKSQDVKIPSDPSKIDLKMFQSADGREYAHGLIKEASELKKKKEEALAAVKKAEEEVAAQAAEAKRKQEAAAQAAEANRRQEAARAAEEARKRQEAERQEQGALERRRQAEAAARERLSPAERRMNAYALASHAIQVDLGDL
mmetsp:Transcript_3373/g.9685  ORF Transcript_3373/g.9685 Transcript_3373/m.9685 type:complete len:502 (+) Transcript_3373:279-1784(+)|eukprot:CAMPEP_0117667368 /NCGR_PEP_ID=MMETSP0804-20121206/10924_1 /TAXON_ID=1074897 /ORGANISM="Tetraselmis astigmatica, Strain CCMP880" /LENGTH=501 /DNA_ID=CAMNT_0005475079 /DNA_START=249 /DNA_END=1754 /DNA_ORIENTATION=-